MTKRSKKTQKTRNSLKGYVPVAYVEDIEQAKDYEAVLKTEDIPVVIKEQKNSVLHETKNFAVMVPEGYLNEAYAVIESQYTYDDFYDFASESNNGEEKDDIFAEDFFDDEDNY